MRPAPKPPADARLAHWQGLMPAGTAPLDVAAREAVLSLYADVVAGGAPPDLAVTRWRRRENAASVPREATGRLVDALLALLRRRVRTVGLYLAAGRSQPPEAFTRAMLGDLGKGTGFPSPKLESGAAMFLAMVESGRADVPTALKRAAGGRPDSALSDFAARFHEDPNLAALTDAQRLAVRHSMPEALLSRWIARFGADDAVRLTDACGEAAAPAIRANRLRTTRDELAAKLSAEGIAATPMRFAPDGLQLTERIDLSASDAFRGGLFEMQDEASQLVSVALDPKPGSRVLDACAGAGGKTLHLAALMKNKGEIVAHDLRADRADELRTRLKRAGADNVRIAAPGEAAAAGPFDAVLIDAPCLGFGTLRRNPDLAWRGELGARIREVASDQAECIRAYAPLVKPGGVLVYAVCSFEAEECGDAGAQIAAMGFVPDSTAKAFEWNGIKGLEPGPELTLLPHAHGTDGFYLSRWKKPASR